MNSACQLPTSAALMYADQSNHPLQNDLGTVGHNLWYSRAEPPIFPHIPGCVIPVSFPFDEGGLSHAQG